MIWIEFNIQNEHVHYALLTSALNVIFDILFQMSSLLFILRVKTI